jgi:uncharacterized protein DUF6894
MLISMPTGTSTIFGVFQAISALLADGTHSALVNKLAPNEKFASEIFCHHRFAALRKTSRSFAARVKGKPDQWVQSRPSQCDEKFRGTAEQSEKLGEVQILPVSPNPNGSIMPRYFFNTRVNDALISDPEGEELGNADRAWEVARAMIRELLKTDGAEGALLNAVLEVTDDRGEIVLEFPFTEAILDFTDISATRH